MERLDEEISLEFKEDPVISSIAFIDLFVIMVLGKVLANFKSHVIIGVYLYLEF